MKRFPAAVVLALILVSSFLLKLNHLGHGAIKALDESFHAVVARNLIKHPLTPTLIDRPYLDYDYKDWQNNHVWLHKPIVPLWQMAGSMAVFGVNTLALRMPSAILATAAVWLTYAIGVRLLSREAALIAAALQAFNPGITSLVHGYVFSDHIDIAFLFWVELAVYFLVRAIGEETKSTRWLIAAGIAQGIAFLSKTYPAFVVTGIAFVIALLFDRRLRLRDVLYLLLATIATIAPWLLYTYLRFSKEFVWEQLQIFRHLSTNVENWAAPWDRLVFDFSLRIYYVFYPAILAATVVLSVRARRERNLSLVLLLAWGFGVLIPHVLATSKTPTATLIGWPPFWLLLAEMIVRAVRGDPWCLGAWFGATTLGMLLPGKIPDKGWGYPDPPAFARIMRDNIWVIWHMLAAVGMGFILWLAMRGKRIVVVTLVLAIVAGACSAVLFARMSWESYRVTRVNRQQPSFAQLGAVVRTQTPPNAVLLLEQRPGGKAEHVIAMFHADRTVYPVAQSNYREIAERVAQKGGLPLFVSERELPLEPLLAEPADGLMIYAIPTSPTTR